MTRLSSLILGKPLALEQLVALNTEIVALTRAGLPLQRGLFAAGSGVRGPLGRVTRTLAGRIEKGESLLDSLDAERASIPPVYRAVVRAGLRSGKLTSALEQLSEITNEYIEARRVIGLAILYPLIVVVAGYGLLMLTAVVVAPRMLQVLEAFHLPRIPYLSWLAWLGTSAPVLLCAPPAFFFLLYLAWLRSGRATVLQVGESGWALGLGRLFGIGGMLAKARVASFADVLALLIEHEVPFHEAIELAGDACGDRKLRDAARRIAGASRNGQIPVEAMRGTPGLPPLLAWLTAAAQGQRAQMGALRLAGGLYRKAAVRRAEWIRTFAPTILILAIGVIVTVAYATSLWLPFSVLMNEMAAPL